MTRTAEVSEDDPSRLVSVVGGGAFIMFVLQM